MVLRIEGDQNRFKQIIRGKIRENLRKYVSHGEMIGRKGKDLVSIPVPHLDVPHFRFGHSGSGGVAQGDGETQEKIDVVKSRLIKNMGYCDVCASDVLNYVASIFARGDTARK